MEKEKLPISEFAIASVLLGIISFVQLAGLEKSILALIFGILALRNIKRKGNIAGRKLSIAGIMLGIISIVMTITFIYFYVLPVLPHHGAK